MESKMKELRQKRFFIRRQAQINETKVIYKSSVFGKENEVTIAYEDVSRNKESYLLVRKNILGIFCVLAFLSFFSFIWRNDKDFNPIIWIFFIALLLASIPFFFMTIEKLWKIKVQYNTYLFFFQDKSNSNETNDFIESLFLARDNYLRETYFLDANKNLPYENQKSNLLWLRKIEAIDGEEFKNGLNKLNRIFDSAEINKIGFN